jgi:hypothetical protein
MGNRMSSLSVAQFCPAGPKYSEERGNTILSVKGSAFHAVCAGAREKDRLLAQLPSDDREEVLSWQRPTDVVFKERNEHVCLVYAEADKELAVGLTEYGGYVPHGDPRSVSDGHLDMAWVHEFRDRTRVAYIGDIKKNRWTTPDGPDTLQCAGYGFAYAAKMGCSEFCRGLYIAEDGLWQWSGERVVVDSTEGYELLDRVIRAATNTDGPACTGAHCWNCWGRLQCPEWLLPAAVGEHTPEFRAISKADPGTMTNDSTLKLLQWKKAAEQLIKHADGAIKAYVGRNGPVYDPATGKHYCLTKQQGRESVLVARVREAFGKEAEKVIIRGPPRPVARWLKRRVL